MSRRAARMRALREFQDVLSLEAHFARGRLDEAQHAAPGRRLAAARLADQAERFARLDAERDVVDGRHAAASSGADRRRA